MTPVILLEFLNKWTLTALPYINKNDNITGKKVYFDNYFVRYYICKEEAARPFPSIS